MKTNIIETKINIRKLDNIINNYIIDNNRDPKYLVMNENTVKTIAEQYITSTACINTLGKISMYNGILIATCNSMEYGEVDIVG